MAIRTRGVALLACCAALGVAGCGGSGADDVVRAARALQSADQVHPFVDDLMRGTRSQWELGDDADRAATHAWQSRTVIASLGDQLDEGVDWACTAADFLAGMDQTADPVELLELSEVQRAEIYRLAEEGEPYGGPAKAGEAAARAEQLMADAEQLTVGEVAAVVDKVCL